MVQTKINNCLYVMNKEAYKITNDTDVDVIYVPEDIYDDYVTLNPELTLTKHNYGAVTVKKPPYIAFFKHNNKPFFKVCKSQGWVEGDEFVTIGEAQAVTDEQFALCASGSNDSLFKDCTSLDELKYFTGLTKIPDKEFRYCDILTKITLPNTITSIGYKAFSHCHSLSSINLPDSITNIGEKGLSDCYSLYSITLPNNKLVIGNYAFEYLGGEYNSDITITINIGDKTDIIDCYCPFWSVCNKVNIRISQNNSRFEDKGLNGIFFKDNYLALGFINTIIPEGTNLDRGNFGGIGNLGYNIKDQDEWKIKSTVPTWISSIPDDCYYATNLGNNVIIPDNIETIGWYNFSYSPIETITISSSLKSVGEGFLASCYYLKTIICKASTPPTLGSDFLYESTNVENIYVPTDSVEAYKSASGWSDYADKIKALTE